MKISNNFKNAVDQQNINLVRTVIKDSMLVDKSLATFYEMISYAKNLPGLYEDYDKKDLNLVEDEWTVDYMDEQMVDLIWNFSKERLDHLTKVVKHIYPQSSENTVSSKPSETNYKQARTSYKQQKSQDAKDGNIAKIVGGVAVGGIVGAVAGSIIFESVIGGAVVGAVVGGIALSISPKSGE